MKESPASDPSSDFLGHMLRNQRAIRNYIYSLHPQSQDLDDLVQQTAMTLWREFANYDTTREFLPWALRVSYFEVLRLRKHRSRDRLVFSEEFLEQLADDGAEGADDQTPALQALEACLSKLDARGREVLFARYGSETTVANLAKSKDTSVHGLYRLLEQARASLVTCIRRHLHLANASRPC